MPKSKNIKIPELSQDALAQIATNLLASSQVVSEEIKKFDQDLARIQKIQENIRKKSFGGVRKTSGPFKFPVQK